MYSTIEDIIKQSGILRNLREVLRQELNKTRILNLKERRMLRMRFVDKMSLEEVGKIFNVTRERVRQIEAKSIEKLRISEQKPDTLNLLISELRVKKIK